MIKEINDLTNNTIINEYDVRDAGNTAKNIGKGAWAATKDIGLNIGDIFANDGVDSAHHADDFRAKLRGEENDPKRGIFKSGDAQQMMKLILSQNVDTMEKIRHILINLNDEAKRNADKSQEAEPQKNEGSYSFEIELYPMILEAEEIESSQESSYDKILTGEQLTTALEKMSVALALSKGKEFVAAVLKSFKKDKLPSNIVTTTWAKSGKPQKVADLVKVMKTLKIKDTKIYKVLKAIDINPSTNDLQKMGVNVNTIMKPRLVSKDNVIRLVKTLGTIDTDKFINELRNVINKTKRAKAQKKTNSDQDV